MQKHVKDLTEIFDELSIIGDPLDEENQVVHLLASLPESYDMLVTALEASSEIPSLKSLPKDYCMKKANRKIKKPLVQKGSKMS